MGFYIIEINDKYKQVVLLSADGELYCKDVAGLMPYTEPDLEQVKEEAYEEGRNSLLIEVQKAGKNTIKLEDDEYYQRGLADAWEAARKIALDKEDGGLDTVAYCEIFGYGKSFHTILKTFTASEVIAKIKEREDGKQEIKVGDEVITASGKAVVTGVGPIHFEYDNADGSHGFDKVKNVKKTGRHFPEIAAVFEKMREES